MSIKFKATAVASMALVANAATDTIRTSQIRLAYHGPNAMMVSWNTFKHQDQPTVHWGLSADNLNETASSNESLTYPTSLTYNNHVLISGLQASTLYYYLPDGLQDNDGATPFNFTTSRTAGDDKSFSIIYVADLGTMGSNGLSTTAGKGVDQNNILKQGEINTIQSLMSNSDSDDCVLHNGDIAYADYWLKESIQGFLPNVTVDDGVETYETILNDFYNEMMPLTALKPWMVGVGNHEANCDNGGTKDKAHNITYTDSICMPGQTNFTGYKNHFRMPGSLSGGTGNFWYSWDHGSLHVIQFDTETDLGLGFIGPDEIGGSDDEDASPVNATANAQLSWLEADLAAVDRTKTPWIVALGHRPEYASTDDKGTICQHCKDVFEPLWNKYKVDAVFSGHLHAYERLAPIVNGEIDPNELNNPDGPWYIVNGAAGHYDGLDELDAPRKPYSRFSLDTKDATYGWSRLTFHNCTHMTHEFIASNNGSVLDSATLFKDRTCGGSSSPSSTGGSSPSSTGGSSPSSTGSSSPSGSPSSSAGNGSPTSSPPSTGNTSPSGSPSSSAGNSSPTSSPPSTGNTSTSGSPSSSAGNSSPTGSPPSTGNTPPPGPPPSSAGNSSPTSSPPSTGNTSPSGSPSSSAGNSSPTSSPSSSAGNSSPTSSPSSSAGNSSPTSSPSSSAGNSSPTSSPPSTGNTSPSGSPSSSAGNSSPTSSPPSTGNTSTSGSPSSSAENTSPSSSSSTGNSSPGSPPSTGNTSPSYPSNSAGNSSPTSAGNSSPSSPGSGSNSLSTTGNSSPSGSGISSPYGSGVGNSSPSSPGSGSSSPSGSGSGGNSPSGPGSGDSSPSGSGSGSNSPSSPGSGSRSPSSGTSSPSGSGDGFPSSGESSPSGSGNSSPGSGESSPSGSGNSSPSSGESSPSGSGYSSPSSGESFPSGNGESSPSSSGDSFPSSGESTPSGSGNSSSSGSGNSSTVPVTGAAARVSSGALQVIAVAALTAFLGLLM